MLILECFHVLENIIKNPYEIIFFNIFVLNLKVVFSR